MFLGIVPLMLIVAALPRSRTLMRRLLVVASVLVVVAVGQHMDVPGLSVIGGLPGLRTIMSVYWAALAGRGHRRLVWASPCRRRCAPG